MRESFHCVITLHRLFGSSRERCRDVSVEIHAQCDLVPDERCPDWQERQRVQRQQVPVSIGLTPELVGKALLSQQYSPAHQHYHPIKGTLGSGVTHEGIRATTRGITAGMDEISSMYAVCGASGQGWDGSGGGVKIGMKLSFRVKPLT